MSEDNAAIYKSLAEPLPPDAIEAIPGQDFSSIKQAYVIERLNEVLGANGWTAKYHECSTRLASNNEIILKCIITSEKYGLYAEGFGSNSDSNDIGNAYKGAKSVSLKNAVLQWGLGLEIHKGVPEEAFSSMNIPSPEQIKKSRNQKFIWTFIDGIIMESQEQDIPSTMRIEVGKKFLWVLVNGFTCRTVGEVADDLRGKEGWKFRGQGYWDIADKIRFVHISRLLGISEVEPMIIPELKAEKTKEKEV